MWRLVIAGEARRILRLAAMVLTAVGVSACGASLTDGTKADLSPTEQKVGALSTSARPLKEARSEPAKPEAAKSRVEIATLARATIDAGAAIKTAPGYKIGPQDVLDISVFNVPELSKSVQVAQSGTINLPLVGDVVVADRSPQDVERDLAARLGKDFLRKPQVTVFVKEYNSQRLTIDGAVKKPGVYPLRGNTTLMQALALAEGVQTDIASNVVVVVRETGKTKTAARFDIEEIRAGTIADVPLQSGDLLLVETSSGKQAFSNFVKVLPLLNVFKPL